MSLKELYHRKRVGKLRLVKVWDFRGKGEAKDVREELRRG